MNDLDAKIHGKKLAIIRCNTFIDENNERISVLRSELLI